MENIINYANANPTAFAIIITALALWSVVWKGFALWNAARRSEKGWFIVLLAVNTLGILEIIYLYAVAKIQTKREADINLQ